MTKCNNKKSINKICFKRKYSHHMENTEKSFWKHRNIRQHQKVSFLLNQYIFLKLKSFRVSRYFKSIKNLIHQQTTSTFWARMHPPGMVIFGSTVPWWAWRQHMVFASSHGREGHQNETESAWPPCCSLWWGSARSPGFFHAHSGWSRGPAQTRSRFRGSSMSNSLQRERKEKRVSVPWLLLHSLRTSPNPRSENESHTENGLSAFGAFTPAFLKLFHSTLPGSR